MPPVWISRHRFASVFVSGWDAAVDDRLPAEEQGRLALALMQETSPLTRKCIAWDELLGSKKTRLH